MSLARMALQQIDRALAAQSNERALVLKLTKLRERFAAAIAAKKTPVAELRELRGLLHPSGPSAKARATTPRGENEMTPAAADRLAKGKWFSGYAEIVRRAPPTTTAKDLDPNAMFGPHVLFAGDVTVGGRFAPGDERGIIVIQGDLSADSVEVGSVVVVVTGKIRAARYVAYRVPSGEGLLAVGGTQKVTDLARKLDTPLFLAADPARRGEIRLFADGRAVTPASLAPRFRRREDDSDTLDAKALLSALRAGRRLGA